MSAKRKAGKALQRLASQFPVIAITGPRQSGKTTLAKMVYPDKKFISFDDKSIRDVARANPKDFLLAFPDGAIIDEAQKVPEIFDAIKYHVDNNEFVPGMFILTGSNQFSIRTNITDSLAGRAAFLRLLPFSVPEMAEAGMLGKNAYETIFKGGYPPLYDNKKHFDIDDWFENYIDSYLDLDVHNQINQSNLFDFKRFVQLCASYSGNMISMENISKNLGVTAPTVKQWVSILTNSFIINFLEPDSNNLGKTLVKTPKMYFTDTGLLCHLLRIESVEDLILHPMRGAIVETFAISELMKNRWNDAKKPNLTFFRDLKGFEVDTIANWKHSFAIEIKSTIDAEKKMSANVRKYLQLRGDDACAGMIYYLGDITCKIDNVQYVGWRDWSDYSD